MEAWGDSPCSGTSAREEMLVNRGWHLLEEPEFNSDNQGQPAVASEPENMQPEHENLELEPENLEPEPEQSSYSTCSSPDEAGYDNTPTSEIDAAGNDGANA